MQPTVVLAVIPKVSEVRVVCHIALHSLVWWVQLAPADNVLPQNVPTPEDKSSPVNEVGTILNDHIHNDVMDTARLSSQAWSVSSA